VYGDAIAALRSAETPDDRVRQAEALLAQARELCSGEVGLDGLIACAEALLHALETRHAAAGPPGQLLAVCHDFIDLARAKPLRRAAYDPDGQGPGTRWLEAVIRLIDEANFTVGPLFRQRAAQYPHKPLFLVPRGEQVTEHTWKNVAARIDAVARGIVTCCRQPGGDPADPPRVALFTPNRPDGAMLDLACLTNGIFITVVPANVVEAQLEHILFESGASLLAVAGSAELRMGLTVREELPRLRHIVTLDELPRAPGSGVISLKELTAAGRQADPALLDPFRRAVRSADVATTMYTSGTTGAPKGIKFTHLNLVSKRFARAAALPDIDDGEVFLCFLPLYHTFGRWLEMLASVHLGATYIFAETPSTETLIGHMQRLRPTAMISVPKKWRDLHGRVVGDAPAAAPRSAEEGRRALARLTGGRLRWGLSAAGRLDPAIFRFFHSAGIELLSGYGMTEATGGITMTPPGGYVEESIGRPLPAIEIRLAEDGELLLRGPYVATGYTNPEDDAAAFHEGWFHTGDLVARDDRGYLRHVDRKKDIYKNASGRTVAPQRIEALFADFPEVSRVFAVGDGREYVTLLIRPNPEYQEVCFERMSATACHEYFRELVVSCNRYLAPFERVVNFALLDRDFSIEHGELTPKGSFRRSVVVENFRDVIAPMYASTWVEREVDGLRVRLPIAFLQHLGATETGARAEADRLEFRAIGKCLRIHREPGSDRRAWVGNCCYELAGGTIDLDDWLRLPELWVGNAELTDITGETILLWSLNAGDRTTDARMVAVRAPSVSVDEWQRRLDLAAGAAPSLLTVHAASVYLSGSARDDALRGVEYLVYAMRTGLARYVELAEARLQLACQHPDLTVRGLSFVSLLEHQPADRFARTAGLFCASRQDFFDAQTCKRAAALGLKPDHWRHFSRALAGLRNELRHEQGPFRGARLVEAVRTYEFVMDLLRSLRRIAEANREFFLPVRRELVAWCLTPTPEAICQTAAQAAHKAIESLRTWLGPGLDQATDPETGRVYRRADTLHFEDGIEPTEVERLRAAVEETELVREAVYLLHDGRRIDLGDLAPGSIWISLLTTRFGRSIYHAGVRTRAGERCDFTIFARNSAPEDVFHTELRLLCLAAEPPGELPLAPQLGGYWPWHEVATAEYVVGQSVDGTARHMHDHPDRHVRQRLKDSWTHISWSALAAAYEFFRRTEGLWTLTSTVTRDVSVPLNDFDPGTRLLSVGGRRPYRHALGMVLELLHEFHDRICFQFPGLAPVAARNTVFAAALESLGEREGIDFLRQALAQAEQAGAGEDGTDAIRTAIEAYLARITQDGYTPRALHNAVARYHAWFAQVPDATAHTRAAQLRELENSYAIRQVARRFPATRLRLYAETVLRDLPQAERATVEQAIRRLREGEPLKEVMARLYAELRDKLASQELRYYLTRVTYPHLEPEDNAELVTVSEVGGDRAELVTRYIDRSGTVLRIRPVTSSREVDMLHRIFYAGGLGGISARDQLLVAVDQTDTPIGGLGFVRRTPTHALLDKMAVAHRWRGRGIGRLMVKDFLRRQAADGVSIITAQLIRRDWLEQFGFRSHSRYPGVAIRLPDELQ